MINLIDMINNRIYKDKKHKKEKKKSKDKEKEREKDKDKVKESGDTPKVKIKLNSGTPAGSPGRDNGAQEAGGSGSGSSMPAIPKIKLKLHDGSVRVAGGGDE